MRKFLLIVLLMCLAALPALALEETYPLDVPEDGEYLLQFSYRAMPGNGTPLRIRVTVDGVDAGEEITLPRLWKDETDGDFERDEFGDELSPRQVEVFDWAEATLWKENACDDALFTLSLTQGSHEIGITAVQGELEIRDAALVKAPALPTYEEYIKQYEGMEHHAQDTVLIQAERASLKSLRGLTPFCDRSSPNVTPNDSRTLLLNSLGGYSWRQMGDWVEWSFNVPEAGFYTLSFHYLQNNKQGMASIRSILLDGEVPFQEWEYVGFDYGFGWTKQELPQTVYLTEGEHTLRLVCRLGDSAPVLKALDEAVEALGNVYRDIIMVTSATPDLNRDYYLDSEIPGMMEGFEKAREALNTQKSALYALGGGSSNASFLQVVIDQLDEFLEDPRCIPKKLITFRSNITALSDILKSMQEQPLALDRIELVPQGGKAQGDAGLLENLSFRFGCFLNSFEKDYSKMGKGGELTVWLSASGVGDKGAAIGRDQAQLIEQMIRSGFTKETGVKVNLSLVNAEAAIVQAIVSGTNPDVVMFAGEGTPVILAVRSAAEDLTQYPGYAEIADRFHPSAIIPFTFEGGVYALPDTQMYYMMYYRTDIFEDMGLEIPNTWDEFYALIKKLHLNNLSAGISGGDQTILEMFLLQRGGNLYDDKQSYTRLTEPEGIEAFTAWTELYTKYGMTVAFDFFNRFRSGEMPIGIMPLSLYATLVSAAPEIAGRWAMAPVPGIMDENGNIIRTESSQAAGTLMLSAAKNKEAAFQFIEWWSRAETQIDFGQAVEAAYGPSSRYFTANTKAMEQLGWSSGEMEALMAQREHLTDIPMTPASYYVSRCLTNAFRNVVYYQGNPREIMVRYAEQMDEELLRKRQEFGLE